MPLIRRINFASAKEAIDTIPQWIVEECHVDPPIIEIPLYNLDWETIGNIIRKRREKSGLSLRSMAKWMSVSPAHLSEMERGIKPWVGERLNHATDILSMAERTSKRDLRVNLASKISKEPNN